MHTSVAFDQMRRKALSGEGVFNIMKHHMVQSKRDKIGAGSPVFDVIDAAVSYLIPFAAAAPIIEHRV